MFVLYGVNVTQATAAVLLYRLFALIGRRPSAHRRSYCCGAS